MKSLTGNRVRDREWHAAKGPGPGVEPGSAAEPRLMGRARYQLSYAAPHLVDIQYTLTSSKTYHLILDRKGQSRLLFLRRLRSFNVCTRQLRLFYQCVVASVIFFAAVCTVERNGGAIKLTKLVRKASSVVGMKLNSGDQTGQCGGGEREEDERKLQAIMDNPSHLLYAELRQLRSMFSHRLIQPSTSKHLGVSNQTTQHHHHSSQHLLSPLIKDSTIHFTVT